jgi:hypothetical protein
VTAFAHDEPDEAGAILEDATRVRARRDDEIRDRAPVQDRGLGLLMIFTAGVLVMVALITLTTIFDGWWMLPAVMAADLALTVGALASIVRLLDD